MPQVFGVAEFTLKAELRAPEGGAELAKSGLHDPKLKNVAPAVGATRREVNRHVGDTRRAPRTHPGSRARLKLRDDRGDEGFLGCVHGVSPWCTVARRSYRRSMSVL